MAPPHDIHEPPYPNIGTSVSATDVCNANNDKRRRYRKSRKEEKKPQQQDLKMNEDEEMEMEPSANVKRRSEGNNDDEESDNGVVRLVQATDALRNARERSSSPQKDTPTGKPSGSKVM